MKPLIACAVVLIACGDTRAPQPRAVPAKDAAVAPPTADAAVPMPLDLNGALAALRDRGLGAAADEIRRRVDQRAAKFRLTGTDAAAAAGYLLALRSRPLLALHEVMPRSTVELVRAVHERDVPLADAEDIATFLVAYVEARQFARLEVFDRNHSHVTGRDWRDIDYTGENMTWRGQRDYWSPRGVRDFKTAAHVRAYLEQAAKMPHFDRVYRPRR